MLTIKSEWGRERRPDFLSVDVRRLHGRLEEFESSARSAREKMDQLKEEGRFDVTYGEVMQLVDYELSQLGLK
jgi:hypothetical protein